MTRRSVARLVALLGLAGTIVPAMLYLAGRAELGGTQRIMLVATLVWFAAAPFGFSESDS